MSKILSAIFISCFLFLVKASNICQFNINQLNGKTLKVVEPEFCDGCFHSDVQLQIQSNDQYITYLRLLSTSGFGSIQTFKPYQQTLVIDQDFKLIDDSVGYEPPYNFILECLTNQVNGSYKVLFHVKINKTNQFFELDNLQSQGILLKFSIILLAFSYILLFV
ncbi:hypothetical protein ABPG74_001590 [Tetrahymena malaccensis]